ncbi:MAG: linear amide C-N hydrolase [Chloroflexi bacterium]|nr:linear amide C-N hydrolase [Chloroflexota bacterium]
MKRLAIVLLIAACLVVGCAVAGESLETRAQDGDESDTLGSLQLIDDYPLYTMTYYGSYALDDSAALVLEPSTGPAWGCSLFAAFGGEETLYGRNFDWRYSPALLLFTDPPDGYASVSLVDIAYLGFSSPDDARTILDLPLSEREALLYAPYLPFDGMNEYGLTVGMAAVEPGYMTPDPDKPTVDSLVIIRLALDGARTVDEALAIFESYSIDMGSGPPIHYLIADREGNAALVEFYQGEMHVTYNDTNWHAATNFIRVSTDEPLRMCSRYRAVVERLTETDGALDASEALDLLASISQGGSHPTQWSVVYGMDTGTVDVVMNRQYETVYSFYFPLAEE